MKLSHENAGPGALLRGVLFVFLLGAGLTALAQDDEASRTGPAAEVTSRPATGQAEPPGETGTTEAKAEDDELSLIVLEDQALFEDEVYLDDDEPIVDSGPLAETDEQRLQRLFALYMDALSDGQFGEADSLAKQIVEVSIQLHGLDSHESAKALTNLAIAQHGIEDYESAILNYDAAIGIIERIEDRLNGALINPLRGLGAAHLASGRPDLARDAFDRAVHVSHVNDGPHNLGQVETLQSLAETYLAVGDFDDAVDVQKRIYYLQARNVDTRSLDIVPALITRASWQRRMQLYEQERYTWRRIISIIEDSDGKESLALIEPLTSLGNSYLYVGYSDAPYAQPASVTSGEIYLKRAIRVAEAHPEADWNILVDTMLELGDYYVLTERANRGQRVYKEVWRLLSQDDDPARLQSRFSKLETVVILNDITPPTMYGGDPAVPVRDDLPGYESGTAVFQYTVSTRGRATDIRVLEADPPGLDDMYMAIARQMRDLVHRPRMQDGGTVATENMTYSHSFLYRQADLPDAPGGAASDDDASTD